MKEKDLLDAISIQTDITYHKRMDRCLMMIEMLYADAEILLEDANILAERDDISLDTLAEVSSYELSLQKALCTMKKEIEDSREIRRQANTW